MIDKNELIKLLPKLIREDDEIKGAIISALSGVVATKEDITNVIKTFKDEIKEIIIHFDKRFEAMDKRFETMQEQMDKRFEAMDKRFEAMQEQMDKRFETMQEQMDKRFEALQLQINSNYLELRSAIDNIGDRGGKGLEEMVLKLLIEQNKLKNIDFSSIERRTLIDEDGDVFPRSYSTDIDILMENGKTILMEIKFKIDHRDIYHFVQVSKLYEKLFKKADELWVLSLEISPKTLKISSEFPVKVMYGNIK
jgi:hypothetical protein